MSWRCPDGLHLNFVFYNAFNVIFLKNTHCVMIAHLTNESWMCIYWESPEFLSPIFKALPENQIILQVKSNSPIHWSFCSYFWAMGYTSTVCSFAENFLLFSLSLLILKSSGQMLPPPQKHLTLIRMDNSILPVLIYTTTSIGCPMVFIIDTYMSASPQEDDNHRKKDKDNERIFINHLFFCQLLSAFCISHFNSDNNSAR